jgi:hypothetical protein
MLREMRLEVVMESNRRKIGKTAWAAGATAAVMALVLSAGMAGAKKKEKVYLPDYVLKAQTVLVVILPDAGEPMDDPFANRKAQDEVEKAFMKWGRYRLALDASTADLVIGVKKGSGKVVSPAITGGPTDSPRPGTIETTDNQIRIGGQRGTPPATTQEDTSGTNSRAQTRMDVGAQDDTFKVFKGGVEYPVDYAPVWNYVAKDGLKPPRVAAVEQFRKAVEESETAAAQKQQQQGQKKTP